MSLTPKELEIKGRCERATPGPWSTVTNRDLGPWVNEDTEIRAADRTLVFRRNWKEVCLNAVFAAKAREDVPMLLETVATLREALQAMVQRFYVGFRQCDDRMDGISGIDHLWHCEACGGSWYAPDPTNGRHAEDCAYAKALVALAGSLASSPNLTTSEQEASSTLSPPTQNEDF
jgi:hypothetical protein